MSVEPARASGKYKVARAIGNVVVGTGWIAIAVGLFFAVFRMVRGHPGNVATLFPFVIIVVLGLALILLGWIARAIFDIADRQ